jgi:hypothetical protein
MEFVNVVLQVKRKEKLFLQTWITITWNGNKDGHVVLGRGDKENWICEVNTCRIFVVGQLNI